MAGYPDTAGLPVFVEFAPGADLTADPGTWPFEDITSKVRIRAGISVDYGRPAGAVRTDPTKCTMTLDGRSNNFSRRNPTGQWWGKLNRNTPVRVGIKRLHDEFGRTTSNDWGNADSGQPYTTSGGAASDYSVSSGAGRISVGVVDSARSTVAGATLRDTETLASFVVPVTPAGASIIAGWMCRRAGAGSFYIAELVVNTTSAVDLRIRKCVAGTFTTLVTATNVLTHTVSKVMRIRFAVNAGALDAKVWDASLTEPSGWQCSTTDTTFDTAGGAGPRVFLSAGNTNTLPVVAAVDDVAIRVMRAEVFVPNWPNKPAKSKKDLTVGIEGSGLLRRLAQGNSPVWSPMYLTVRASGPVAYWPLEGRTGSGLPNGPALIESGTIDWSVDSTVAGSDLLPDLLGTVGVLTGTVTMSSTGAWTVQAALGSTVATSSLEWTIVEWVAGGATWVLSRTDTNLLLSRDGTLVDFVIFVDPAGLNGARIVQVTASQSGADLVYRITLDAVQQVTGTLTTTDVGVVSSVRLIARSANAADVGGLGHVAFYNSVFTATTIVAAMNAHVNEPAGTRVKRTCGEHGIKYLPSGFEANTALMGPQPRDTLPVVLRQCEDADQGVLYEKAFGLGYIPRSRRYNQAVDLALDFDAGDIAEGPEPDDSDRFLRNEITVTRIGGGIKVTVTPEDTHEFSIKKVGRYDSPAEVNLSSNDVVADHAWWRLHLGVSNALWWPALPVDFASTSGRNRIDAWLSCRLGSRLTAANEPDHVLGSGPDVLADGWHETFGYKDWDTDLVGRPAEPFTVNLWDSATYAKWDTAGSKLRAAITSTATTADVVTTAGPLWTTTDAEDGFPWYIDGEAVTVDDIAASLITYGAVGTATHADNAGVTPGLPASVAEGNALYVLAAIRNSGTGVPVAPANYVRLPVFEAASNVQLFGKVAGSSEAAPAVTFTGGAAGATCSAQMIRLAGKFHDINNLIEVRAACLNASAQDITFPGLSKPDADNCFVLYIGWKQDDVTSIVSPGTEIAEASTITGDDQTLVWAYAIQTAAAAIATGTFAVTGGAAAISRGAVVAIRCDYQTATITRSVNGVVKAHAANTPVRLLRPFRWAL